MKKILRLLILTTLTITSSFVHAHQYADQRNKVFILEKDEFLDDMYPYLLCLLTTGDKGDGNVKTVSTQCKDSDTQNSILRETKPTEQLFYSSLKPYGSSIQTLILCLAEGGARRSRAPTKQVIEYCDKVVQPID